LKNIKDFIDNPILIFFASAIAIYIAFFSNDKYLKIAGLIIYNIILFRKEIRNLLSKQHKKFDQHKK
jgi:hypothetical protein